MPPLSRLHFAVPGADSGGGCDDGGERGSDRPLFPSCQEHFLDFVALSKWLLEQLGGGGGGYAGFESAATDAPVAVCADILQACQRLGFEPSQPDEEVGEAVGTGSPSPSAASPAAATVSPTNLAVGSGTAVLELLGWLSHAVLIKFGSSTDDGHVGGGGGGSGDSEDGEAVSCPWGKGSSTDGLAFMGSMIEPTVDPAEWRAEQERVAPRLARAAPPAGSLEVGTYSWASRVEVFSKAAAVISSATAGGDSPPQAVAATPRSTTPGGQGNGYGDGYSSIGGKHRKDCLESMLVRHRGEVLQQLMAMTAGEQRVNNLHGGGSTGGGGGSGNLPCFQEEALLLRDQERALLEELEERKARVAALTIELRDAEAAVDETEVEVREAAADCSDPTKLFKTKSAIRQLKADVKAMDVLIGAKSATFLGKQQGVQRAAREAEHSAPVGSRWGGLNSRAGGGEGGGGGGGARTTLSTPSPSVSPALVAGSSSTEATTNTASTPSSGSSRGGSGGVGVGGVVRLLGKPKAPEVGDGAGGPRRGGVLIQAAMRLLATGQGNATATATQGRAEAEAEVQAQAWAEAGAGGNNQDHQMLAGNNCIHGDDWLDEKERE
ncbi:hypothetical protein Esi_0090_0043 [Ectocarpus siliculosus]|uniref:Uncharacterized protein n=1 Tax=Ectocarpus siliculosus TaxID=2880 RepID=D8LTX5_ECTSI|nr:hypothetical protein Esi_0090_0043 [Ectocarpus siliculosus]|eukprot:CBN75365.1 hypothetical protein Esi_0090_0043 [Ectocarpus siliculosus]